MLTSGLATFMPKYFEQQFNLSPSISSLLVGIASLPGAGGGTFIGGYLVKRFDLKCGSILKFCTIFSIIGSIMFLSFFISCKRVEFAGINTLYHDQVQLNQIISLESQCNNHCNCGEFGYNPICGKDNVMYYSSCQAGCTSTYYFEGIQVYTNCSCIREKNSANPFSFDYLTLHEFNTSIEIEATRSNCQNSCNLLLIFCFLTFIAVFCTFIVSMPSLTATLR